MFLEVEVVKESLPKIMHSKKHFANEASTTLDVCLLQAGVHWRVGRRHDFPALHSASDDLCRGHELKNSNVSCESKAAWTEIRNTLQFESQINAAEAHETGEIREKIASVLDSPNTDGPMLQDVTLSHRTCVFYVGK